MKKLLVLVVALVALFSLTTVSLAADFEQRVYLEVPAGSDFWEIVEQGKEENHYDRSSLFDDGVVIGYEAAFASGNKDIDYLAGANLSLGAAISDLDTTIYNIYGGARMRVSNNKFEPYVVGRAGIGVMDVDLAIDMELGYYLGIGAGMKPMKQMNIELMYLVNKNDVSGHDGRLEYNRWSLSAGYIF